jgi:plastocyanin
MRRAAAALAIAELVLVFALVPGRATAGPAALSGRLSLGIEGASLDAIGPVVVYLDPLDPDVAFPTPSARPQLKQENARFSPEFQVIVKGQTVDMPNFDAIYHNVFSYSRPNDFDLGTYAAGQSRSVRFQHPGVVRTYCSIHERMNATIFVAPSPWFAVASRSGHFVIGEVPAGDYVLRTWSERLPATARTISLAIDQQLAQDIDLVSGDR